MSGSATDNDPMAVSAVYGLALYVLATAFLLLIYGICYWFAGDWMVLSFGALWKPHADIGTALGRVWFIFPWGAGVTLLAGLNHVWWGDERNYGPVETFVKGWWLSANAGFFEELMFRWLTFFTAMVVLRAFNAITFGFVEWLYTSALIPAANWATFHALDHQLQHLHYWILGAAVISANADFRDDHKYLGPFGFINAWFLGMVMFWLVFNYGLWAAIVAHILYDGCIFTSLALIRALQPSGRTPYYRM